MTTQAPTLVRCERCKAVVSSAEAAALIRDGVPCGVCGGPLSLCCGHHRHADGDHPAASPERRLLGVLREADGAAVAVGALCDAGIEDPAAAIYELERAGHAIEREYGEAASGRRRLIGYRLRGADPLR